MLYRNQYCSLNTIHSKGQAISGPFLKILGINVIEQHGDTDQLGTFSGEVERPGNLFEVLKKKCEIGIDLSGFKLSLASEGSFGPHPFFHFLPCDYETIIFMDKERDFFLYETLLSEKTNYKFKNIKNEDEFFDFAKAVKFPSHGIIIRPIEWDNKTVIFKGIQAFEEFQNVFKICQKASLSKIVRVETDMRAHMNPTRMTVIKQLAKKLCRRLKTLCPKCGMPGWGKVRIVTGLECTECSSPTEKIKEEVFGCVKCTFEESYRKENNAGPENCPICNP